MSATRSTNTRKNVLIIMTDQQRADTLGCYGNRLAKTPNIDRLAEAGTRFDACYTPYSLCCPARASLWTGMMPHNHHVLANWFHIRPELRDGGFIQRFTEQGYHTTYTGKWHVPGTTPERLGYRSWAAIPDVVDGRDRGRYISEYRAYATAMGYNLAEGNIENLTVDDLTKTTGNGSIYCGQSEVELEHYLERWQTGRFLEELEASPKDKPFFAVCSYNAPHFPMIVPAPFDRTIEPTPEVLPPNFRSGLDGKPAELLSSKHYQQSKHLTDTEWSRLIAHYWGFCSLIDHQVGTIVDWLRAHDKLDDTIIVYVSDHGDMMGSHGLNLKGFEVQYEETNRVPLIIVDPDGKGGVQREMLVSLIDLMPTIADLCGVETTRPVDGASFAGAMRDQTSDHFRDVVITQAFAPTPKGSGTYEDPERYTHDSWRPMNICIRSASDAYIFHGKDIDEYYDLKADPLQNDNRYPDRLHSDRVSELRELIIDDLSRSGSVLAGIVSSAIAAKRP